MKSENEDTMIIDGIPYRIIQKANPSKGIPEKIAIDMPITFYSDKIETKKFMNINGRNLPIEEWEISQNGILKYVFKSEYDSNGNLIQRERFDAEGKLLSGQFMEYVKKTLKINKPIEQEKDKSKKKGKKEDEEQIKEKREEKFGFLETKIIYYGASREDLQFAMEYEFDLESGNIKNRKGFVYPAYQDKIDYLNGRFVSKCPDISKS